jgi:hypothetical protein
MNQRANNPHKGCLAVFLQWFRFGSAESQINSGDLDPPEETDRKVLVKKIRVLIKDQYPEKLWLTMFSEDNLNANTVENLQEILYSLEHPQSKEPAE